MPVAANRKSSECQDEAWASVKMCDISKAVLQHTSQRPKCSWAADWFQRTKQAIKMRVVNDCVCTMQIKMGTLFESRRGEGASRMGVDFTLEGVCMLHCSSGSQEIEAFNEPAGMNFPHNPEILD